MKTHSIDPLFHHRATCIRKSTFSRPSTHARFAMFDKLETRLSSTSTSQPGLSFPSQTPGTTMTTLNLSNPLDGEHTAVKCFPALRDYLQPDSSITLLSTSKAVLTVLPSNDPLSEQQRTFSLLCILLAEQIPWHHPAQLKLAELLRHMGRLTPFLSTVPAQFSHLCYFFRRIPLTMAQEDGARVSVKYQRFGEALRDHWIGKFDALWPHPSYCPDA